ncbi:MAG TPA: RlmE family RNA methyltransferase [Candidatus Binatia bacterium]|jgi:23S rRNA (uridine2552-2'-O)-methyltransferase|nr:RlmE family RNA methyltransferase [Candidatus Binatia bacterium]
MAYQPKDAFYRKAKQEGYRSRAAYKLKELARRFRLIKPGDRVLDLGAAPGGWLQVAAELAGPKGKIVAIDLQPIAPLGGANVVVLQADATTAESKAKVKEALGGSADCVLSDLAPRLSGIRDADISRSLELVRMAHGVARELLGPGGSFVAKTFAADELRDFFAELKRDFASVERTRPEATRKGSSEIYFCARGFKVARD